MAEKLRRGTISPRMMELERQAELRVRDQELMSMEQDRISDEQARMQAEQDRVAQEEYEMEQYYESEALKHAEEMRIHQDEVRRHQERVRQHERRIRDHEASMEAFAKVIAMPARPSRTRQVSQFGAGIPNGSTGLLNGANGPATGSPKANGPKMPPPSFPNGTAS